MLVRIVKMSFTKVHIDAFLENFDAKKEGYIDFEVIEPRYAKASVSAIVIPEEAYNQNGEAEIRVYATKYHKVSGVAMVTDMQTEEMKAENLALIKAEHMRTKKDVTECLNSPMDKKVVETLPGDIIDLTFKAYTTADENAVYLITVGGVYAEASFEDQKKVAGWVHSLDRDAVRFLSDVYHESYNHAVK